MIWFLVPVLTARQFSMRGRYDSRTLWMLTGVASRIGQGMGLHRDGSSLGLSPFETEMRRRLWWQLIILDAHSAELSGSGVPRNVWDGKIQLPLNVNDADLDPEMTEPPPEHTKPTEMIGCMVRYSLGRFRLGLNESLCPYDDTRGWNSGRVAAKLAERDKQIDELEQYLEDHFLKHCDPSVPAQFHASILARVSICTIKLMVHHPGMHGTQEGDIAHLPSSVREMLFSCCVKIMEIDNLSHSARNLQRFRWHMDVYFQWHALIYLLTDLQLRTTGDEVDKAWREIDEVFEHHPDFITDTKRPLHVAIGNLCLKAYGAREQTRSRATDPLVVPETPTFISLLRAQRTVKPRTPTGAVSLQPGNPDVSQIAPSFPTAPVPYLDAGAIGVDGFDMNADFNFLTTMPSEVPSDWSQWDHLLHDFMTK